MRITGLKLNFNVTLLNLQCICPRPSYDERSILPVSQVFAPWHYLLSKDITRCPHAPNMSTYEFAHTFAIMKLVDNRLSVTRFSNVHFCVTSNAIATRFAVPN
jgi:hypothetical protein